MARLPRLVGLLALSGIGAIPGVWASLLVVPGGTWTASNGAHLQAHGAGVTEVNGTYYLVGEDKTGGSAFQNVNCYSSTDLVQWHYEGALLSRSSGDLGTGRIVERPKVIYNDKTAKYVLWMHADSSNYGEARVGVAVGDSVCGKYTYLRSFRPLGFQSRDMNLFKDDDGAAYLLSEDRENGLRIIRLTDDYLDVSANTYLWKEHIEAPAMLKHKGRYYMFGSRLTGWDPNDNMYSTSTSLTSGWTGWTTFADKGSNTYSSQTHYILPYGSDGSNVMYMGDRWVSKNLQASTYVWLPLTISASGGVSMKNQASWTPNVQLARTSAGTAWSAGPDTTSYDGTKGSYGGGAKDVACDRCASAAKKAAGYIGGAENGTLTISGIHSDADTAATSLILRYQNSESKPRYAAVSVNGGAPTRVAFLPAGSGSSSSVVSARLKKGDANTVVISGIDGGWGPDIDRLLVPVE